MPREHHPHREEDREPERREREHPSSAIFLGQLGGALVGLIAGLDGRHPPKRGVRPGLYPEQL
jgi:hypothetical protein